MRSSKRPVLIGRTTREGPGLKRLGPSRGLALRAVIARSLQHIYRANSQGTPREAGSSQSSRAYSRKRRSHCRCVPIVGSVLPVSPNGDRVPQPAIQGNSQATRSVAVLIGRTTREGSVSCTGIRRTRAARPDMPPRNRPPNTPFRSRSRSSPLRSRSDSQRPSRPARRLGSGPNRTTRPRIRSPGAPDRSTFPTCTLPRSPAPSSVRSPRSRRRPAGQRPREGASESEAR